MPCYIYVIEIDKAVSLLKKFTEANPRDENRMACFYVGQSALTPEERHEQHKSGYKHCRYVKKYGIALRPMWCERKNPVLSQAKAEEKE